MRNRLLLALAAGLLLTAADAPKDEDVKKERERLQGTWIVVLLEEDGDKKPDDEIRNFRVIIKEDRLYLQKGNDLLATTYRLDPAKKPKQLDVTPAEGKDKGKTWPGIYELDGDALKICGADVDKPRPEEFKTKAKGGQMLMVMKREK